MNILFYKLLMLYEGNKVKILYFIGKNNNNDVEFSEEKNLAISGK